MTTRLKLAIAAAFAVVGVAAVAGWTRQPAPVLPVAASYDSYGQPLSTAPTVSTQTPAPAYEANYEVSEAPAYLRRYSVRQVRTRVVAPAPVYYRSAPVYRTQVRTVRHSRHHKRSTAKSVAIVAGSAGVGAAIGGIAGGGKGAGIGALAGGAGGFVYDRLTHKH